MQGTMPITSLRLIRFKCYEDSRPIPLSPMTLIFGRNNSGKSSILQSLFLLRQTIDAPEGPRLNLRGPLYRAGSYADLVHQHRALSHMEIHIGVALERAVRAAEIQMEFASDEPQPPRITRFAVSVPRMGQLEIRRARGRGGPYEMLLDGEERGNERAAGFRFPVNGFFPLIGAEPPRRGRPSGRREELRRVAGQAIQELENSLTTFRAVGAFRSEPIRRYEYQGRAPDRVDLAGQDVVNSLIEDSIRPRPRRGELVSSVNRWLRAVGGVRLLPLRRISKTARLYELRLKDTDSGRWANLADVGFGIGQAFPILIEGLRTRPGAMFLVQEPEIHLHPDAQLAMADFLLHLAASGRRLIVETHSEPLLLRLRRRIVESAHNGRKGGVSPADVSVVHVSKKRDGGSDARVLRVDDLGQIEDWPSEFMEEATAERLHILESIAQRAEP